MLTEILVSDIFGKLPNIIVDFRLLDVGEDIVYLSFVWLEYDCDKECT